MNKEAEKKIVSKEILINRVRKEVNYKNNVKEVVDVLLEVIDQALIDGEEIRLIGHFIFKTEIQKPRVAMNLQTKKKMIIPAKRVPKVRFSGELKKKIATSN
jgi:DNA-binding protein HU-beta